MMRTRARAVLATIAVACLALLAGCAGIPTSGGVNAGVAAVGEDQDPFVFRPAGPAAGASPEQILRGFIAAAVRPQNRYETARDFLTPEFAATWDPGASVLLHETPNTIRATGAESAQLMMSVVGQVGRSGNYTENDEPVDVAFEFEFEQVDGEWRINEAPSGVILLQQTFARLFTQRTLYFFDPGFTTLVPDVRWFPNGADTPTRVVDALIAGPSPALAPPVLTSAFPGGTALDRPAVVGTGGEAVIDFERSMLRADIVTQQRMRLQLTRSLIGGSIVTVEMQAGGVEVDVPEFDEGVGPILQPQVDPRAAVGVGDRFGWLSSGDIVSINGLSAGVASLAPTAVALDAAAERAAVRSDIGVSFVGAGSDPVLVDTRPGLIAPALDTDGYVWTVPSSAPGQLNIADAEGGVTSLVTPWGDLESITALGVAKDGTRLFVYGDAGSSPVLRVHGIVRDGDGRPVSISEASIPLVPPAGEPVSATWVDEITVASMSRSEAGDSRVVLQTVGGRSETLNRPAAASTLVGTNGESGLRVLSLEGDLQVLRGAGWQNVASDVAYVANQR